MKHYALHQQQLISVAFFFICISCVCLYVGTATRLRVQTHLGRKAENTKTITDRRTGEIKNRNLTFVFISIFNIISKCIVLVLNARLPEWSKPSLRATKIVMPLLAATDPRLRTVLHTSFTRVIDVAMF